MGLEITTTAGIGISFPGSSRPVQLVVHHEIIETKFMLESVGDRYASRASTDDDGIQATLELFGHV